MDPHLLSEETSYREKIMAPEAVEQILRYGAYVGSVVQRFDRLGRGMDHARQLIRQCEEQGRSFASGTVIVADELSGGKGRFQRYWHAPSGGIWMTLVVVNTLVPEISRLYSLAAGMACCEAINLHVPEARIKWVNDVHVGGKKLCGVLIETMHGPVHGEEYVLIGVGINVNNTEFPAELETLACSMQQAAGRRIAPALFLNQLLLKFVWNIGLLHHLEARYLRDFGPGADASPVCDLFFQRWRQLSDTIGRKVRFGYDVQQSHQYEAVVLGVEEDGGLRLQNLHDGGITIEHSGEIVYID